MTEGVRERIASALEGLEVSGLVRVSLGVDDYYDAIRGLLENRGERLPVLVSATIPQHSLLDVLRSLDTDVSGIRVIDCISISLLEEVDDEAVYLESPRLLESLLMSLGMTYRDLGGPMMLIVDSFDSLLLHNNQASMALFLQAMSHRLRESGGVGFLLSLREQADEGSENMLRLLSEMSLEL